MLKWISGIIKALESAVFFDRKKQGIHFDYHRKLPVDIEIEHIKSRSSGAW